ncbi:hypothetical protein, partial [Lacticigenium naphthae]|uniref:hypothetical protein n=1 Tax=Lacticigenium naphthae TaxID=515351 RepID=UPI0004836F21
MKEWHFHNDSSTTLLIDHVTHLKGTIDDWKDIVDLLKTTFNDNKITIYEGNEKINVHDYRLDVFSCSHQYTSSDVFYAKEKAKSLFLNYLELSPFYKRLVESWEELQEEVDLLSEESGSAAKIHLDNFSLEVVTSHMKWKNKKQDPLDKIIQQISFIKKVKADKQHICVILSPELILDNQELIQLDHFINMQKNYFIIISSHSFNGVKNIRYNNRIFHQQSIISSKERIENLLPFVFDEKIFNQSINWYMKCVDNCEHKVVNLSIEAVDNLEELIYVLLMLLVTKIAFIIDYTGIPDEYKKFIESVI